jgi:hypothetical protein
MEPGMVFEALAPILTLNGAKCFLFAPINFFLKNPIHIFFKTLQNLYSIDGPISNLGSSMKLICEKLPYITLGTYQRLYIPWISCQHFHSIIGYQNRIRMLIIRWIDCTQSTHIINSIMRLRCLAPSRKSDGS